MVVSRLKRLDKPTVRDLQNQLHEVHECVDMIGREVAKVTVSVNDLVISAQMREKANTHLRRLFFRGVWAVVLTVITAGSTVVIQNWMLHVQAVRTAEVAASEAHTAIVTTTQAEREHYERDQQILAKLNELSHKHK